MISDPAGKEMSLLNHGIFSSASSWKWEMAEILTEIVSKLLDLRLTPMPFKKL